VRITVGLYYNGARYLAAWLGRWTSADPIGLQAGLNLYQYCRGSPINYVDPSGTQEVVCEPDCVELDPTDYGDLGGTPGDVMTGQSIAPAADNDPPVIHSPSGIIYPDPSYQPRGGSWTGLPSQPEGPRAWLQRQMFETFTYDDFDARYKEGTSPEEIALTPNPALDMTDSIVRGTPGPASELWLFFAGNLRSPAAPLSAASAPSSAGIVSRGLDWLGKKLFPNADSLGEPVPANGAPLPNAKPSPVAEGQSMSMGDGPTGPIRSPNWRPRDIKDPACSTGCEAAAGQIQKQVGGQVIRIEPAGGAPTLGSYRGKAWGWAHHDVVLRAGRVYDAFTGGKGLSVEEYKALWQHADHIKFGF